MKFTKNFFIMLLICKFTRVKFRNNYFRVFTYVMYISRYLYIDIPEIFISY